MSSMEQYLKELECPVCLCVRGGCCMFVCQAGHQVCAPCHNSLPKPKLCPECRGPYDYPLRHNLVVERFISRTESPVSCGNWRCKEMVQGVRMAEHMAECEHRMVPCPYPVCPSKVLFNNVSEHIKVHDAERRNINEYIELALSEDKELKLYSNWDPFVFEVQGQRFYLQCLFRNNIFMALVIVEGGREEAVRWRASVSAFGPKKVVICNSEVFPIDMTTEDMINSGDCLVMNENELVKFNAANMIPIHFNLIKSDRIG